MLKDVEVESHQQMEYLRRRNLNAAPWIGDGSAEPTHRNHRFVVISDLDKLNRTWTFSECEKV